MPARRHEGSGNRVATHAAPTDPTDQAHDRALVERIRGGDASAWDELLAAYQHRLFTVCMRMLGRRDLAEEAAQDTMVRLMEGLSSYDGRARLSTWIIRVAMNVCLSRLRRERHRRHPSLDGSADVGAADRPEPRHTQTAEPSPASGVELSEQRDRLAAALRFIGDDQRAILILRDVQGLDYDEIARVLEVPVGTVKSRLFRARAALRAAMESQAFRPGRPARDQDQRD